MSPARLACAVLLPVVALAPPPSTPMDTFVPEVFALLSDDDALRARVREAPHLARRMVYDLLEQNDPSLVETAARIASILAPDPCDAAARAVRALAPRARRRLHHRPRDDDALRTAIDEGAHRSIPYFEARLRRELATRLHEAGRLDRAREEMERVLERVRRIDERFSLAWDLWLAGTLEWDAGRPLRALGSWRESYEIAESLEEWRLVRPVAERLGGLCAAIGRYADAIRFLRVAVDLTASGAAEGRARVRLAGMYSEVGLTSDAEQEITRALELLDDPSLAAERRRALATLALAKLDAGDPTAALELLDRARGLGRGSDEERAERLQHRGRALLALDDAVGAEAAYRECARLRSAADRFGRALALSGLGDALLDLGRSEEAAGAYREAIDLGRGSPGLDATWRASFGLARLAERAGDREEAARRYREAIDGLECVRRVLVAPTLRVRYLGDKLDLYRLAARTFARAGRIDEAFRTAGRAKARTLLDLAALRPAGEGTLGPASTASDLVEAEERLLALERRASQRTHPALDALVEGARADHQAARIRVELDATRGSVLTGLSEPASLATVQSELPADAALVEYLVGPQGASAIVVRRESADFVELPAGAAHLAERVERVRRPFDDLAAGRVDLANLRFDACAARELERALVSPLRPHLEACTLLLVVPDGVLRRLPFALLVTEREKRRVDPGVLFAQYTGCRFLVEELAIGYLPAAGLFACDEEPATRGAVVLGDPSPLPPGVDRLRHARDEARAIGERLCGARLGIGPDATAEALSGTPAVVHLATHAMLDDRRPAYSRLALAGRFLHAYEIERLRLPGARVVLSACETVGDSGRGEGFLGLTRAFLVAGARSVVAASWVVDDAATARLMDHYYRALGRGASPVRALRQAQIAMLRRGRRPGVLLVHPFFWAGFLHLGR